ncbi:DNA-(apurinic or apyrimidinic site) lyase [Coxiella burnetii]|uniref:exodeoxyribonuclease III n=1 Tax=Coxiella burnetii TaxID=777 RepID=UPI0000DAEBC6|nr:exodeoxyribonuclease III [Coxiella burnetii]ABX79036.1 exodeoxyribonuclease III [Coxiella burnetii RSA 331]AML49714.1 DNA-(apurinic or apyrimidinic site) lyase [Coxiella burnetii]AML55610.1 DNA-(apurinic or apyrimidinic site) lyase [Coxiella burnetii]ATN69592.1 DNA-(apurinic or apyrimidinic site) lyase [Coxiella burnetii]ATN71514.1 DNA-(apurinic or apyrimidinic site) lyase [Coxiella burnetii]
MRIITLNLNGIRAAARRGFFDWLKRQKADIVCLQETKACLEITNGDQFHPKGYHCYYHDAEKSGYSGVGIYCREKPDRVTTRLGWEHADKEGRYIQADFGSLSVASLYMPSGTTGEHRQKIKFDFMDRYMKRLKNIVHSKRSFIICGDWNIVHKEIDIKNFKSNQKHSGCLPEERAWLDEVFTKVGLVDAFRVVNQKPDQYTWWSSRGRAWEKNVGWRIDYQVITSDLKNSVKSERIYKDKRFSDHAPLIIDYEREISD